MNLDKKGDQMATRRDVIAGLTLMLGTAAAVGASARAKTAPEIAPSIARFALAPQGTGTLLTFDHAGFPKGEAENLAQGWKKNYWQPLEKMLA